jgi:hypothetical protein
MDHSRGYDLIWEEGAELNFRICFFSPYHRPDRCYTHKLVLERLNTPLNLLKDCWCALFWRSASLLFLSDLSRNSFSLRRGLLRLINALIITYKAISTLSGVVPHVRGFPRGLLMRDPVVSTDCCRKANRSWNQGLANSKLHCFPCETNSRSITVRPPRAFTATQSSWIPS